MSERLSSSRRKSIYELLLDRDGPWCHYCDVLFETGVKKRHMTIDHAQPLSYFGTNAISNLVLACYRCNYMKDSMPYEEFIESEYLAERRATIIGSAMKHYHESIMFTKQGNWSCLCGAYGTKKEDPRDVECPLMRYAAFYRPSNSAANYYSNL